MANNSEAESNIGVTRRTFLGGALGVAALGATSGVAAHSEASAENVTAGRKVSAHLDVLRLPDSVTVYEGLDHAIVLTRAKNAWQAAGIEVECRPGEKQQEIRISAEGMEPTHVHLRWKTGVAAGLRVLGDHWERSYGDLSWRGLVPERVMPWYFATFDGALCHGYGVKTGAGALCFWQLDPEGVSLWLNVQNGGGGVQLGSRQLLAATIVSRAGLGGETPFAALRAFCKVMCEKPRLPGGPIYGTNDWYYAYGKNSAEQTLRDADLVAGLSVGHTARPFAVIDMGWENSPQFPEMGALAAEMKRRTVRPGIWIRPLLAPANVDRGLLLADARFGSQKERAAELAYDPTIPEALERVTAKVKQVVEWGFELVKHDFSTYDILGKWGFEMGAEPTHGGWSPHDRTRTNAEIILDLYRAIRKTAEEKTLILGCNTVGHLGAGLFEMQRTGDDTSGEHWERTRRMGVNTLAFRLAQHGTFFAQDADCVGITKAIPWEMNRQWLDVLARSGTALFISPAPDATGAKQKRAIGEAFAIAEAGGANAIAQDWMETTTPEHWSGAGEGLHYRWCEPDGAWPFSA